jgi:hypothetical protein
MILIVQLVAKADTQRNLRYFLRHSDGLIN